MTPPNIALIVLDTLRKDALYRQSENLPAMRILMRDGVKYENAKAPASWTLPSHVSIFTGRYPSSHGVHYYCDRRDSDRLMFGGLKVYSESDKVLPRQMRKKGYHTISLSANLLVSHGTGLENGYDECEAIGPWATIGRATEIMTKAEDGSSTVERGDFISQIRQDPIGTIKRANAFLAAKFKLMEGGFPKDKGGSAVMSRFEGMKLKEPFFAFLNLMEAHEPYLPFHSPFALQPDSFREQLRDLSKVKEIKTSKILRMREKYQGEVIKLDSLIGRLIKHLRAIDAFDDTLIVVTSDHGQSLKEHGFFGHGLFLHDELTDIPLVVKYPEGRRKESTEQYVSLLDLKSFFESWGEGEPTNLPGSLAIFAESYGVPDRMLKGNLESDFHLPDNVLRKCVWKDGHKLTLNGTNGRVESLTRNGMDIDIEEQKGIVEDLSSEIEIFAGNESFLIP